MRIEHLVLKLRLMTGAGGLERSEGAKAMKEGEGGKVKVKIKPKV